jgi:hypothetical protein
LLAFSHIQVHLNRSSTWIWLSRGIHPRISMYLNMDAGYVSSSVIRRGQPYHRWHIQSCPIAVFPASYGTSCWLVRESRSSAHPRCLHITLVGPYSNTLPITLAMSRAGP